MMKQLTNISNERMRQSNMELLRIISMMMVLVVHVDGASLGLPSLNGNFSALDSRNIWQLVVESLAIIGVNCFTLISGYFSIRLRLRTVCVFLFQCIFYSVSIYFAFVIYEKFFLGVEHPFSLSGFADSVMVLTHTDLWYVPAYFMLMLLAPMLNAGFEQLPPRRMLGLTGVFVLYNIWGGWLWHGNFNPTGYTVVQLIMMYCIGRSIAVYGAAIKNTKILSRPALYFGVYLLASFITAFFACYNPAKAFAYNQPTVVIASVALFMCFKSMHFRSRFVNYAARSAFAVYLIHKTPVVWGGLMKPLVRRLWGSMSLTGFTFAAVLLIICIYLLAMAIDPLRRTLSDLIFKPRRKTVHY